MNWKMLSKFRYARSLIAQPGGWGRTGNLRWTNEDGTICRCAIGALQDAGVTPGVSYELPLSAEGEEFAAFIQSKTDESHGEYYQAIYSFNDWYDRTQEEVVAMFDAFISSKTKPTLLSRVIGFLFPEPGRDWSKAARGLTRTASSLRRRGPASGHDARNWRLTRMKKTAEQIVAEEVDLQDRKWGLASERGDAAGGQFHMAAIAQLIGLEARQTEEESDPFGAESYAAKYHYPDLDPSWKGGFRDYGSDIANLAVAGALIVQEIRRKLALGESTERTPRPIAA